MCESRIVSTAERVLGAFISAVTELYGPEQARISAEDWIEEFESMDTMPGLTTGNLRSITIAAAGRLASRSICGAHLFAKDRQSINAN